ncbi:hypothetical protein SAMN02745126_04501 [Enhydrobacter aerosaccus]|uniref:Uncharacterized protein n=1 Tax=Enhydrobacter aerosaccus TaxID=225324 RepID=A0A1T4SAQ8_9HYPH|nr:hypothetical protein [Enhydrobacter aerosaccus]SKA25186.1 hypothetical protein SAMN02745126_04501 [Enhydrobacter aerosaccus]
MRLGKWHRQLVIAALGLVGVSGVLWFALHDVMDRAPDDLLHWLLVAHGVTAYLSAVAFGSLLPLHVVAGWRYRRHLISGFAAVVTLALLIGSALLLYYGGEETQAWARLVHIATGFGAVLAVPIHIVLGRRLRKQTDRVELRRVLTVRAR